MKKETKNLVTFILVGVLLGTFVFLIILFKSSNQNITVENTNIIANTLKDEVTNSNKWFWTNNKEDYLIYSIERLKSDENTTSLRIFDKNKVLIYEEEATYFSNLEVFDLLRSSRRQLIIKAVNYGGSGRFFKVLDYQEGKIVCLTNEDETLYSGDIQILPQYHVSNYNSVPYQVFLSEYVTSSSAEATVLRYINGKYVSVGKVNQSEIGNFIEKNIYKEK